MNIQEYANINNLLIKVNGDKVAVYGFGNASQAESLLGRIPGNKGRLKHIRLSDKSTFRDMGSVNRCFSATAETFGYDGSAMSKEDLIHTASFIHKDSPHDPERQKIADGLMELVKYAAKLREGHEILVYKVVNGSLVWEIKSKEMMQYRKPDGMHYVAVVISGDAEL